MSKKLLAVAIAAALAPAAVMAEASNVTMYGRIDYGFVSRGGDDGAGSRAGIDGRKNEFEDGIAGGNRLGFRGKEDLGNGLKAIFEFEFGFNGDTNGTGSGLGFNRHSWIGLEGAFGTVFGGRVDGARYSFVGQYDPFKNQTVGNAASVFGATSGLGQADRADNAVVYISPEVAPGLKFLAAYSTSILSEEGSGVFGVTPGVNQDIERGDTPLYAIAAMYNNGPISLTLDYENLQVKRGAVGGSDLEFDIWVAGGSYDFGVVKLSAYYENTKGDDSLSRNLGVNLANGGAPNPTNLSSDGDGWFIGATVPVTANFKLLASYVKGNDDRGSSRDIKKYSIGGEYAFSKRTYAYGTFAKLSVDDGIQAGLTTAGRNSVGGVGANGAYGDTGFNIGLAHTF